MQKAKEILTSWRFWAIVLVSVVQVLKSYEIVNDEVVTAVLTITQYVAGAAAVVRTVDRFGETKPKAKK